jgi:hypothetical protein
MPRPNPSAGGEVDGEDGHVGDRTEHEELGERAEDRDAADGQRQQSGDHAAEGEQQQHEGERHRDRLGDGEAAGDLARHVVVDTALPPGEDGDSGALPRVPVDELDGTDGDLGLVADDVREHEALGGVGRAQAGRAGVEVGDDVGDIGLARQGRGDLPSLGRHRRVVDRAGLGGDHQHEVGLAPEPVVDELLGLGRLGSRVVEAAVAELAERPRGQNAGPDHEQDAYHEQEPGPSGHELAVPIKHGSSP